MGLTLDSSLWWSHQIVVPNKTQPKFFLMSNTMVRSCFSLWQAYFGYFIILWENWRESRGPILFPIIIPYSTLFTILSINHQSLLQLCFLTTVQNKGQEKNDESHVMTFEAKTNFFGNKMYTNLNCYTLLQSKLFWRIFSTQK